MGFMGCANVVMPVSKRIMTRGKRNGLKGEIIGIKNPLKPLTGVESNCVKPHANTEIKRGRMGRSNSTQNLLC